MNRTTLWFILAFVSTLSFSFAQEFNKNITESQLDSIIKEAKNQVDRYDATLVLSSLDFVINQSENFKKDTKNRLKASAYNLVGYLYYNINSFKDAIDNFEKADLYAKKLNDNTLIATISNNLGLIYIEEFGEIEKGLSRFDISYKHAKLVDKSLKSRVGISIATAYFLVEDYKRGYSYLKESTSFIEKSEFQNDKAVMYYLYGKYYWKAGKRNLAEKNFRAAISLGSDIENYKIIADSFKAYSGMLKAEGELDLAYNMLSEHVHYKTKEIEKKKIIYQEVAKARFPVNDYKRALKMDKLHFFGPL